MTIQTAVLIETLVKLGAGALGLVQHLLHPGPRRLRHCRGGRAGVRLKGESLEEYWCIEQALTWPDGKGPNMISTTAATPPC